MPLRKELALSTNDTLRQCLTPSQIEDLRVAAAKMHGAERRSFQAEMTLKYCQGSARLAETIFGWGRESVETGLGEKRTGIVCLGAQSGLCGNKCWEENHLNTWSSFWGALYSSAIRFIPWPMGRSLEVHVAILRKAGQGWPKALPQAHPPLCWSVSTPCRTRRPGRAAP